MPQLLFRLLLLLLQLLLLLLAQHSHIVDAFATTSNSNRAPPASAATGAVANKSNNISNTNALVVPWKFQGYDVYVQVAQPAKKITRQNNQKNPFFLFNNNNNNNDKPDVVLIHGFACSTLYWRATVKALCTAGYTVHALDLLGQGQSDKPGREDGIEYSIALWAELVDTYIQENIVNENNKNNRNKKLNGVVLIGNSLGSLVALQAATADAMNTTTTTTSTRDVVRGIGMFNCGIGLNSRNIAKEPQWNAVQRWAITAVYNGLTSLIFGNVVLLAWVLNNWVTRDVLRQALESLYPTAPQRVDDALVDSFYEPAQDKGAVQVLRQIYTNDAGRTPMELHARHADFLNALPIHLVWGNVDVVTPVQGGLGQYYAQLAANEKTNVSMQVVTGGHVLFDEVPGEANEKMLTWLESLSSPSPQKK